ncbi:MAG: SGNH/GDSL hydrolase family protein [Alphaproteobacteria bacterium]|nr:SGNH/GDSL hydrolase family protein [Alphaproteobacteria bacterium]
MIRFVTALWNVVGLLLLVVLAAEFGVDALRRGLRRLRHGTASKPSRTARADAYQGAEWPIPYFDEFNRHVRVDYAPYVGWWLRPFRGHYVTIDERGLRDTPGEHEAGPGATRILCFGGSTMMGMGARDDHTIAAELAQRLRAAGNTVSVTNLGQLGHNNTQETLTLQRLLKQGERPDLVLFYDGVNEMICVEHTGLPDRVMFEASRRAEFNLLFTDRRAALLQGAAISLFPRTVRRLREWTGLPLRGPLPGGAADLDTADLAAADLASLAQQAVEAYAGNLRLVRLLGQSYGFRPIFFWQPVITTKRVKSADELFFEAEFISDVTLRRRLFDAVIAAYRRHPEIAGAPDTVDLSQLFDEHAAPLYIDLYHLSEAGNAAVAAAMQPVVTALLPACRATAE